MNKEFGKAKSFPIKIDETIELRKEKQKYKQIANRFLVSEPVSDKLLYRRLYQFDEELEMAEVLRPIDEFKQTKKKKEAQEEVGETEAYLDEEKSVVKMVRTLFKVKNRFKINKIQNAMYEDKNVKAHLLDLISGEDAIAFFAKYGNTTPVKFIHCIPNSATSNPYKLLIVHDQTLITKARVYYTVSPSGIIIIHQSGKNENGGGKPTEFISLSDWMKESTQFNILSNVGFFRNYLRAKLLGTWHRNYKRQHFLATRSALLETLLICKPAFSGAIGEAKNVIKKLGALEMINLSSTLTQHVELEDFKILQREWRQAATKSLEGIFDELIVIVGTAVAQAEKQKEDNNQVESADSIYKSMNLSRPLNLLKRERLERIERRRLSLKDITLFVNFFRSVNYIALEALIDMNNSAIFQLKEELNRDRKIGLFTTLPFLTETGVTFHPQGEEIFATISFILDENVRTVGEALRLLNHPPFAAMITQSVPEPEKLIPDLPQCVFNSKTFRTALTDFEDRISHDFAECRKRVEASFSFCRRIEFERNRFSSEAIAVSLPHLEDIRAKLTLFREFKKEIAERIKDQMVGILQVESKAVRNSLMHFVIDSTGKVLEYLNGIFKNSLAETDKIISGLNEGLILQPVRLKEYSQLLTVLENSKTRQLELENSRNELEAMYKLLSNAGVVLNAEDKTSYNNLQKNFSDNSRIRTGAEDFCVEKREIFVGQIQKSCEKLALLIEEATVELDCEELGRVDTPFLESIRRLNAIKLKLDKIDSKRARISETVELMRVNETVLIPQTEKLKTRFELKSLLWNHYDALSKKIEEWQESSIKKLDASLIEVELKVFEKFALKSKSLKEEGNKVYDSYIARIDSLRESLPLLQALSKKVLKEKHWRAIINQLNATGLHEKAGLSFLDLRSFGIADKFEEIEEIVQRATEENLLDSEVDRFKVEWVELKIQVTRFKETQEKLIVSNFDDLFEKIENFCIRVQVIIGSKYLLEMKETMLEWKEKFNLAIFVLGELFLCQKKWSMLESIFCQEEVQRQLPKELSFYLTIDRSFHETILSLAKRPNISESLSKDLLPRLVEIKDGLDSAELTLKLFAESKRRFFNRLYLLSDTDLIRLISLNKNYEKLSPFIHHFFNGVKELVFGINHNVIGVKTSTEQFSLKEPISPNQPIEEFLKQLETGLRVSLSTAFLEYFKNDTTKIPQPILQIQHLNQEVLFTFWMEDSLDNSLNTVSDFVYNNLEHLVKQITISKEDIKKESIRFLLYKAICHRDTVSYLQEQKTFNSCNFNWQAQVRTYLKIPSLSNSNFEKPVSSKLKPQTSSKNAESFLHISNISSEPEQNFNNVLIQLGCGEFPYAFELLPFNLFSKSSLQTERHLYNLLTTAALGLIPAVLGNNENFNALSALAVATGNNLLIFSCNTNLCPQFAVNILRGTAQSGLLVNFGGVDLLEEEILSVFVIQLMAISSCLKKSEKECELNGQIFSVSPTFGVFMDLQKKKLPRLLKKGFFRQISTIQPDLKRFFEAALLVEGFPNPSKTSKNLDGLFSVMPKLLGEQKSFFYLSQLATETFSRYSSKKKVEFGMNDEKLLHKSFNEASSLFFDPVEIEQVVILSDYYLEKLDQNPDTQSKIISNFNSMLSEKTDKLVEILSKRKSAVLVGPSLSGKSSVIEKLKTVKKFIWKDGNRIFPKANSTEEMFYSLSQSRPGILPSLFIDQSHPLEDFQLFVFDLAIDSNDCDSLIFAFDEHPQISIPNGTFFQIPSNTAFVFETDSLESASPAFCSKAAFLFFTIKNERAALFDNLAKTIRKSVNNIFSEDQRAKNLLLSVLNDAFFSSLQNTYLKIGSIVDQTPSEANRDLSQLIAYLSISAEKVIEQMSFKAKVFKNSNRMSQTVENFQIVDTLKLLFGLFCAWLYGSSCENQDRAEIDQILRSSLPSCPYSFFDFYLDGDQKPKLWTEGLQEFKWQPEQSFSQIRIKTSDNLRLLKMLEFSFQMSKPVLLLGNRYSGKSSLLRSSFQLAEPSNVVFLQLGKQSSSNWIIKSLNMNMDTSSKNLVPKQRNSTVFFIDDLHMPPIKGKNGIVQEMVRQLLNAKGFHDPQLRVFRKIHNTNFVFTAATGAGLNLVDPRLFSCFQILRLPEMTSMTLESVYLPYFSSYLREFDGRLFEESGQIVQNSIRLMKDCVGMFPQKEKKWQYIFNANDLSVLFYHLTNLNSKEIKDQKCLYELWAHEFLRTFGGKLLTRVELQLLSDRIAVICSTELKTEVFSENIIKLFFSNVNGQDYCKVEKVSELMERTGEILRGSSGSSSIFKALSEEILCSFSGLKRLLTPKGSNVFLLVESIGSGDLLATSTAQLLGYGLFSLDQVGSGRENWVEELKKAAKFLQVDELEEQKRAVFIISERAFKKDFVMDDLERILLFEDLSWIFSSETVKTNSDFNPVKQKNKLEEKSDEEKKSELKLCRLFKENLHFVVLLSKDSEEIPRISVQRSQLFDHFRVQILEDLGGESLQEMARQELLKGWKNLDSIPQKIDLLSVKIHLKCKIEFAYSIEDFFEFLSGIVTGLSQKRSKNAERKKKLEFAIEKANEILQLSQLSDSSRFINRDELANSSLYNKLKNEHKDLVLENKMVEEELVNLRKNNELNKTLLQERQTVFEDQQNISLPFFMIARSNARKLDREMLHELSGEEPILRVIALILEIPETVPSLNMVSQSNFLDTLQDFNPMSLSEEKWLKVFEEMMAVPPIQTSDSESLTYLFNFCKNMSEYYKIKCKFLPSENLLHSIKEEYEAEKEAIALKENELKILDNKISPIEKEIETILIALEEEKSQRLKTQEKETHLEFLIKNLNTYVQKWNKELIGLKEEELNILGDLLLSTASITYYGRMDSSQRTSMTEKLRILLQEENIPSSIILSPIDFFGKNQKFFYTSKNKRTIDNCFILFKTRRVSFVYDCCGIAKYWIKEQFRERIVLLNSFDDPRIVGTVENAIKTGQVVVFETLNQKPCLVLENFFCSQFFQRNGQSLIVFNGKEIQSSGDFRMFVFVKSPSDFSLNKALNAVDFSLSEEELNEEVKNLSLTSDEILKKRFSMKNIMDKNLQIAENSEKFLKLVLELEVNFILEEKNLKEIISISSIIEALKESLDNELKFCNVKNEEAINQYHKNQSLFFLISALQTVSQLFPQFIFSLDKFFDSVHFYTSYSENQMLEKIFCQFGLMLSAKERSFFFFIFSMYKYGMNKNEITTLIEILNSSDHINELDCPNWLSNSSWSTICSLSKISPEFKNLPEAF